MRAPRFNAAIERNAFLALLVGLTLGLAWIVWPFYGAVFWAVVLAVLFEPLNRRLLRRFKGRATLAALATLAVILVIVILPTAFVAISLVQEVAGLYQHVRSGDISLASYFDRFSAALPAWASHLMDRLGLGDLAGLQGKLAAALTARGEALAGRAVNVGQDTVDFLIGFGLSMYMLFFLLRDGPALAAEVRAALPLAPEPKARLLERFTTVIRATVKGNILVAAAQGALGGLAFWVLDVHSPVLWAVMMAFLSLLPAIGAALVWAPVALFLIVTGQLWQGVGLVVFSVVVIGLIDNILRPILVGKNTRLPDYLILLSTIGGLAVVGLNGFVIGPVIAAMFVSAWQLFASERQRRTSAERTP